MKTKFKNILLYMAASVAILFPVLAPVATHAVDVTSEACQGITNSAVCRGAEEGKSENPLWGPNGALTRVISVVSMVLAVIAVIVLVVAGIRFTLSQGNSQSVGNIRATVIYAAVGLVVAALAQAIVQLVLNKLP
jgi:hypothetical protein